jgi:hypothetical protein
MKFGSSDYFRKHKKWIFALLTLIAMFVFIVGDSMMARGSGPSGPSLGSRLHAWLYGEDGAFLTVDGRKMGPESIGPLLFRRQSALGLVATVEQLGWFREAQNLGLAEQEIILLNAIRRRNAFERQMALNQPWSQGLRRKLEDLSKNNSDGLYRLMGNPDSLTHQALLSQPRNTLEPAGVADFLYWRERAEQMNLHFPPQKMLADLLSAGRGRVDKDEITSILRNERIPYKLDDLLAALDDEVKVMLARGIIQGSAQQSRSLALFGQVPSETSVAQVTPLDLWEGYVQLKTQWEVGILPIKVFSKEFVDPVPTPTLEELQALYEKYKDQLESDSRDTPGFKLPQLFRIEFVYGNLRETMPARKHYDAVVTALEQLNPLAWFAEVYASYQNRQEDFRIKTSALNLPLATGGWARAQIGADRPQDRAYAANLIGSMAAFLLDSSGLGVTPFLPINAPLVQAVPAEQAATLNAALVIGQALAAMGHVSAWVGTWRLPHSVQVDQTTPFIQVFARVQYDLREDKVRALIGHDFERLRKDIEAYQRRYIDAKYKFRSARRASAAKFEPPLFDEKNKISWEDHVRSFCQKRGLVFDGMKELRPVKTLLAEPVPTPLTTLLKPMFVERLARLQVDQLELEIAKRLTEQEGVFRPVEIVPNVTGGKWLEIAMHWQAERTEERIPPFEECEKKVRDAWFLDKARAHALAFAEKMAAEARQAPDGYRVLVDRPAYRGNQVLQRFELSATGLNYQPAKMPIFEEPPDDLLERARNELQKAGDVMIVWNKPRTYVYVVHLRERREPRPDDAKTREEFDFKVLVPETSRQILVSGVPFSTWVQNEKATIQRRQWEQFIRAHVQFNETEAAKAAEQLRSWLRESRAE